MFTHEELNIGVKYLQDHHLLEQLKKYELSEQDMAEEKIYCLDEFSLFSDTAENIDKNIDFIFDLEKNVKTGSCYGLAKYIYELLLYIKYSLDELEYFSSQ